MTTQIDKQAATIAVSQAKTTLDEIETYNLPNIIKAIKV